MIVGVIAEESLLALAIPPVSLYVDPDVFPLPTIKVPGFLMFEGPFDEGDIVYQAYVGYVSLSIYPNLLADNDSVYAFTTTRSIAVVPTLFQDTDVVYVPIVNNKILGPPLFIDVDVFGGAKKLTQGKATINQSTTVDPVFDADIFRSPIIELADSIIRRQVALSASVVFASGRPTASILPGRGVIIAETLSAGAAPPLGYLSPNLVSDADIIFTATAFGGLAPTSVADNDVFFAPSAGIYLRPALAVDSDIIPGPAVTWQLRPSAVSDTDIFIGPTVNTPGRLGLVTDDDSIFAATLGFAPLAPSLIGSDDAILVPVIGAPALKPGDGTVDFTDTFFAPVLFATQTLAPHLWIDVDNVLAPAETLGIPPLLPGIVTDADAFLAPSVAAGPVSLLPGAVTDTDTFFVPLMSGAQPARMISATRAGIGSVVVSDAGSGKAQVISNLGVVR